MLDPDNALSNLKNIVHEFGEFCNQRGGASEADTRAKIIDRILHEVLDWPDSNITREEHVTSGYIDYCLTVNNTVQIAIEAKKEGSSFALAKKHTNSWYNLDGVIATVSDVNSAIIQARKYCDDHDPPIRYAIATNGYTWIVFRAIREDIVWRKGRARVFLSIEDICTNFTDFWNLLSYNQIQTGSLSNEFSSSLKVSRQLHRVNKLIFNAELPMRRNHFNDSLRPLISLFFDDIAEQDEVEILQSCYVHTGSLNTVAHDLDMIITEPIPKFLVSEGTKSIGSDHEDSGFGRSLEKSLKKADGRLFLLLGGIGSGKTTFLKRYQRTIGKAILEEKTLWFAIDFLKAPPNPSELEGYVWSSIFKDIRNKYGEKKLEKLSRLRAIFSDNISALESTVLVGLKKNSPDYDKVLGPYLAKWQEDFSDYIPRLLKYCFTNDDLKTVLFIDNVDQLAPAYQAQIFLLAQRVCKLLNSISLVSLREESYYSASIQKTFTAFSISKFHIASPKFRELITSRISYTVGVLNKRPTDRVTEASDSQKNIADFLHIVQQSIFDKNKRIARFIEAICHGNMRLALQLFSSFLTSGATDVDKMLKIYYREGKYNVAYHEFVKSVMLGDRVIYNEDQSPIMNIFNTGSQRNSSHFTSWRVLNVLLAHTNDSTSEGRGYVDLSILVNDFESKFDNREDTLSCLSRLLARKLLEANTKSSETLEGASHVRATSAGWYYLNHLICTFGYLDLVLQDTPFDDPNLEKYLRDSVYRVNNLMDREDEKIERVNTRIERVRAFIDYLVRQETHERTEYSLRDFDHPYASPIMPFIRDSFDSESAWIQRRLIENRERFEDDLPFRYDIDAARSYGVLDD